MCDVIHLTAADEDFFLPPPCEHVPATADVDVFFGNFENIEPIICKSTSDVLPKKEVAVQAMCASLDRTMDELAKEFAELQELAPCWVDAVDRAVVDKLATEFDHYLSLPLTVDDIRLFSVVERVEVDPADIVIELRAATPTYDPSRHYLRVKNPLVLMHIKRDGVVAKSRLKIKC